MRRASAIPCRPTRCGPWACCARVTRHRRVRRARSGAPWSHFSTRASIPSFPSRFGGRERRSGSLAHYALVLTAKARPSVRAIVCRAARLWRVPGSNRSRSRPRKGSASSTARSNRPSSRARARRRGDPHGSVGGRRGHDPRSDLASVSPMHERVTRARRHPGAAWWRARCDSSPASGLRSHAGAIASRILILRCLPQVAGTALDALEFALGILERAGERDRQSAGVR